MADHPDANWLATVVDACAQWLDHGLPACLPAPVATSAWPAEVAMPTSQLTGGGAVAAVEAWIGQALGGRRAMMVPSATYGLRLALEAVGVRRNDEVLVPGLDWPATVAAVRSLGARPMPVDVDPLTLTLDPALVGAAVTRRTRAVVACHLHGVAADVPAVREAAGALPIVEDCAQVDGTELDDRPAGSLGDVAVLSLGPGKAMDAGEGGVVVTADAQVYRRLLTQGAHPLRQLLSGVEQPVLDAFSVRPHPVAAVVALAALARRQREHHLRATMRDAVIAELSRCGIRMVGADSRRRSTCPTVPVWAEDLHEVGVTSGRRRTDRGTGRGRRGLRTGSERRRRPAAAGAVGTAPSSTSRHPHAPDRPVTRAAARPLSPGRRTHRSCLTETTTPS